MPAAGVRSTYSQAPFRITMCDLAGPISTGTGFHYLAGDRRYIVTNWHNVTGKDFFTGRNLSPRGRTPLWIEVETALWVDPPSETIRRFGISPRRVEIYGDVTAQLDPLWLEHPALGGRGCDVVAIRDDKPDEEPEFMHNSVNKISDHEVPVMPGEVAFVIGFPRGLRTGFGLPIWKSTFIASEPHYDVEVSGINLPAFFLDGYTREGMSGSPVFARFSGMHDLADPYKPVDPSEVGFWERDDVSLFGSRTQFIGVYSGRISETQGEAALGLCWKAETLAAICGC